MNQHTPQEPEAVGYSTKLQPITVKTSEGKPVVKGSRVTSANGTVYVFQGVSRLPGYGGRDGHYSSGRVSVLDVDYGNRREFFPSVFGLTIEVADTETEA